MISINHPLISDIECLRSRKWYAHRNVLPFIPVYVIALSSFWKVETIGACIILGTVAFFHLLSFFLCIWSLRFRIRIRYDRVLGSIDRFIYRFVISIKLILFMLLLLQIVVNQPYVIFIIQRRLFDYDL